VIERVAAEGSAVLANDGLRGGGWESAESLHDARIRSHLGEGDLIRPEDLPETVLEAVPSVEPGAPIGKFHDTVTEFKKRLIVDALEQSGGNITRAAELLDLNPTYLHRLIRNFGIKS
jgi:transcriptional regulator with GAF, ATPase, and Fis domain